MGRRLPRHGATLSQGKVGRHSASAWSLYIAPSPGGQNRTAQARMLSDLGKISPRDSPWKGSRLPSVISQTQRSFKPTSDGRPFRAISLCVWFPGLKAGLFAVRPLGDWHMRKKMSKLHISSGKPGFQWPRAGLRFGKRESGTYYFRASLNPKPSPQCLKHRPGLR